MRKPQVIIVAGPNGAGKSTTSSVLLSETVPLTNYINPDLIARGLAPLDPSSVSFAAGRIVHHRIRELMRRQMNFAFETTLSGRTYVGLISDLQRINYHVEMVFLWIDSADLAVQRVSERVTMGGHNIPEPDIRRRYEAGIGNFFGLYSDLVNGWRLYENSGNSQPKLIALKRDGQLIVSQPCLWQKLLERYHD